MVVAARNRTSVAIGSELWPLRFAELKVTLRMPRTATLCCVVIPLEDEGLFARRRRSTVANRIGRSPHGAQEIAVAQVPHTSLEKCGRTRRGHLVSNSAQTRRLTERRLVADKWECGATEGCHERRATLRMNAAECLSAAERCEPTYRDLTLAVAEAWLSLARQQQAIDELLGIWGTALSDTSAVSSQRSLQCPPASPPRVGSPRPRWPDGGTAAAGHSVALAPNDATPGHGLRIT
jgi:hypothetical protein